MSKAVEAFFEELAKNHPAKVGWDNLSGNPNISEAFFERNLSKVDWGNLSGNPNISEAFFERHIDEVD